jgi:DNA replication protein DnaD
MTHQLKFKGLLQITVEEVETLRKKIQMTIKGLTDYLDMLIELAAVSIVFHPQSLRGQLR